ncbi:MAG: PAS domain S-box protein [candidate division Zixibacteria bacterium]|nr:PAS domain S-box protein [candidate division Zixibacteria bacterium]
MADHPTGEELEQRAGGLQNEVLQPTPAIEAMHQNEQLFRALVESSSEHIFVIDPKGNYLFSNDQVSQFGAESGKSLLGRNLRELYPPKVRRLYITKIEQVLVTRQPVDFEHTMPEPDGKRHHLDTLFPIFGDGELVAVGGICRDISDRKRMEEALRQAHDALGQRVKDRTRELESEIAERKRIEEALFESEAKYRALVEQSVQGIVVIQDGRIVFTNPAFSIISGYTIEELYALSPEQVMAMAHPDDQELVWGRLRKRLKGKLTPRHYEFRGVRKDKSERWLEMHASLITYNSKPAVQGTFIDITERKRAEDSLRASEEKYKTLTESSVAGIYILQDEKFVFVNEKFAEMHGYQREEMYGKEYLRYLHPNYRELVKHRVSQRLEGLAVPDQYEIQSLKKDGKTIWLEVMPTRIQYGRRPAILGTIIDITERKRAEEMLGKALQEKEVLLKEIHHRVKNNMQIITSLLKLQQDRMNEKNVKAALTESQNRVKAMALVHESLYLSDSLAQIDLNQYLNHLARSLFRAYGAEGRGISLKVAAKGVNLGIEQCVSCGLVMNELMSNALRHAFPEGRSGEIKIRARLVGKDEIELMVSDNGVGLPKGVNFRDPDTLGLGLARGLIENQLGGTLDLSLTRGTRFVIRFKQKAYQERA